MEDPDQRDEIEEMEKRVRRTVEGQKVTQSEDQILQAAIFEHKRQRELTKKLNGLALIRPQSALDEVENFEV